MNKSIKKAGILTHLLGRITNDSIWRSEGRLYQRRKSIMTDVTDEFEIKSKLKESRFFMNTLPRTLGMGVWCIGAIILGWKYVPILMIGYGLIEYFIGGG